MNWPSILTKKEQYMYDFEFIVIEKFDNDTVNNMDKVLLTREAFWCSQLCTLQANGLNKRSEFNSKYRKRLINGWHFTYSSE